MSSIRIVIDTNILLSGLKSKNGLSYKLLRIIPENKFIISVSVPLILEYEATLKKNLELLSMNENDIDNFINYICKVSEHTKIFYLWRPILKDPYDDHILELAVASNSKYIITFNIKDFKEAEKFGIKPIEPKLLLLKLGVIK